MTRDLLLIEETPSRRRIIGGLRNLLMAPAAALATHKLILPTEALVTPADASARFQHHLDGLQQAFADLYPQGEFKVRSGIKMEGHDERVANFAKGGASSDGLRIMMLATATEETPLAAYIRQQAEKKGLLL